MTRIPGNRGAGQLPGAGIRNLQRRWQEVREARTETTAGIVVITTGARRTGRVIEVIPGERKVFVDIGFIDKDGLLCDPSFSGKKGDEIYVSVAKIRWHPEKGYRFYLALEEPVPASADDGQAELWRDTGAVLDGNNKVALQLGEIRLGTVNVENKLGAVVKIDMVKTRGLVRNLYGVSAGTRLVVEVVRIEKRLVRDSYPPRVAYRVCLVKVREWTGPTVPSRKDLPAALAGRLPKFKTMTVWSEEPWGVVLGNPGGSPDFFIPRCLMGERLEATPEMQALKTGITESKGGQQEICCDVNFIPVATALLDAVRGERFFEIRSVHPISDPAGILPERILIQARDCLEVHGFRYYPEAVLSSAPNETGLLLPRATDGLRYFSLDIKGLSSSWDEWDLICAMARGNLQVKKFAGSLDA